MPEFNSSSQPSPDFKSYLNKVWFVNIKCAFSCLFLLLASRQLLCCCFHPTLGTFSSIGRALTLVRRLRVRFPYCPVEIEGSKQQPLLWACCHGLHALCCFGVLYMLSAVLCNLPIVAHLLCNIFNNPVPRLSTQVFAVKAFWCPISGTGSFNLFQEISFS